MSDLSLSASQLAVALNDLLTRLEHYGYTNLWSPHVKLTTDKDNAVYISALIQVYDDFQSGLDWQDQVQLGFISFEFLEQSRSFRIPSGFMTREMREMAVTAKRLGKQKELMSRMTSAFAQEYVRRLTEDLERFQQITHQPA